MRPIDGDELLEKMYRYTDNEGAKMPYGDDDSLIHRDSVCFLIENAPTIEPERKKGMWILDSEKCIGGQYAYRCSECRFYDWMATYTMKHHRNFCPNCGARMDMREGDAE